MKLRHASVSIAFVTMLAVACAAQQDIVKTVPDAAQCIESSIMSFVSGVPDIAGIMAHCGATVTDVEKVISDLKNQDAGVSASPERAARIGAWEKALDDYKASHPGAK